MLVGRCMRDKWYADKRDLVKWGSLVALAEQYDAKHILQILYYRQAEWPEIDLNGHQVPLHSAVTRHFRLCARAVEIEIPAEVEILADTFADRAQYHQVVLDRVRGRQTTPGIILLDPDTGLEPQRPSLAHVLSREVADVWTQLVAGDMLALYQHQTNRNGRPWISAKKGQFERAIGLRRGAAGLARSKGIARDVVLFYAQKPAHNRLHRTRSARQ